MHFISSYFVAKAVCDTPMGFEDLGTENTVYGTDGEGQPIVTIRPSQAGASVYVESLEVIVLDADVTDVSVVDADGNIVCT